MRQAFGPCVARMWLLGVLCVLLLAGSLQAAMAAEVVVGSKKFTESVILGEIMQRLLADAGVASEHRAALGGSRLVFNALRSGEIDAYIDYTGTIEHELLAGERIANESDLGAALAKRGIVLAGSLGFEDNYALGMPRQRAAELGIVSISDLRNYPDLRLRLGNEFMERADGWPNLKRTYRLPQTDVLGVDHDLAYRAIAADDADLTELYTTDAEIAYYDLRTLSDDLGYFPRYAAVLLYRADLAERSPEAVVALRRLLGAITVERMIEMNAAVKIKGLGEGAVAAKWLGEQLGVASEAGSTGWARRLWRNTLDHVTLVGISLLAAVALAIPLGIIAAYWRRLGQFILAVVGVLQTIPALALLVFMIPLFGIGALPALVALFLYSLLPIVRNTHAGIVGIAPQLRESAAALGLPTAARLWRVELPLALPTILAGIKTAAVINVGAATLGALIGAGGYGQPILTGIRLDDVGLILEGAVPSALLALFVQALFELAERRTLAGGSLYRSEA